MGSSANTTSRSLARARGNGDTLLFAPREHCRVVLGPRGEAELVRSASLIGSGLSRSTLREVGPRPFLQGAALWILVGTTTLTLILAGWIRS